MFTRENYRHHPEDTGKFYVILFIENCMTNNFCSKFFSIYLILENIPQKSQLRTTVLTPGRSKNYSDLF